MRGISVIVPVKNEERYIEDFVKNWRSQSIPFELIFIDTGSVDNTVKFAKEFSDKFYSTSSKRERDHGAAAYARNIGILNAKNEIVVNTDIDIRLKDSEQLKRIVDTFINKKMTIASTKVYHETGDIVHIIREAMHNFFRITTTLIIMERRLGLDFPCYNWYDFLLHLKALGNGYAPKLINEQVISIRKIKFIT